MLQANFAGCNKDKPAFIGSLSKVVFAFLSVWLCTVFLLQLVGLHFLMP